jgi:hypothetical protein
MGQFAWRKLTSTMMVVVFYAVSQMARHLTVR